MWFLSCILLYVWLPNDMYIMIGRQTFGPVHNFNGHRANFYISTHYGHCSVYTSNSNPRTDAHFFCRSFYGKNYIATEYREGYYENSGRMGYQMHKGGTCTSHQLGSSNAGDAIAGTDCEGYRCRILQSESNYRGLYNIICSELKEGIVL